MMAVLVRGGIDDEASGDWMWRWYACGVELVAAKSSSSFFLSGSSTCATGAQCSSSSGVAAGCSLLVACPCCAWEKSDIQAAQSSVVFFSLTSSREEV